MINGVEHIFTPAYARMSCIRAAMAARGFDIAAREFDQRFLRYHEGELFLIERGWELR